MKANDNISGPAIIDQMDEAIALIRTAYTASYLIDHETVDEEANEAVRDTLHYGLKRLDTIRETVNETHRWGRGHRANQNIEGGPGPP